MANRIKIGQLVKSHIKNIFHYCDTVDHEELSRLMDAAYSKKIFDINYPFCKEASLIPADESKRYWTTSYLVRGKTVRVTSQWFDVHISKSRENISEYLHTKKIAIKDALTAAETNNKKSGSLRLNSRYRGNAIGNAQNQVIRNILSNLGEESFGEKDWAETKEYCLKRCAYCGSEGNLVMEHAVPINRKALGEHRLGNLVPSCKLCNVKKGDQGFRDFLCNDPERIKKIEEYMDRCNYVPLGDNEQVKMVLKMAYEEVSSVSDRYIAILNELFPTN